MKNSTIKSIFSILFIITNVIANKCGKLARYKISYKKLNNICSKYKTRAVNSQSIISNDARTTQERKKLSHSFEVYKFENTNVQTVVFDQYLTKKTQCKIKELKQLLAKKSNLYFPISSKQCL
ncbi:MAG: hypothetical protein LBI78_01635 [Campylobacteraceae bacterium]|jgi:hypothetical protein|nr:hypothetical protein [Campylobacteraceae bacterium]